MKHVMSLSEIIDTAIHAIVRRALRNADTRELLLDAVFEDCEFERQLSRATEDAISEHERNCDHPSEREVQREIEDAIGEKMNDWFETKEFTDAVGSIVEDAVSDIELGDLLDSATPKDAVRLKEFLEEDHATVTA